MDSTQINCIAIDDEPAALRIIESFASKVGHLNMLKTFGDPLQALTFLNTNNPQLIFLDINMPDLSGIEFMKSLANPPFFILTTAYSEYALESYEYEVIDYLLKPIAFTRFLKAVNKASAKLFPPQTIQPLKEHSISLHESGIIYNVPTNSILYLQAYGNYLKIFTSEKSFVVKSGLQEFLDKHQIKTLCRIHKSYAVNVKKISKMTYAELTIGNQELPIGRNYKETIRKVLST